MTVPSYEQLDDDFEMDDKKEKRKSVSTPMKREAKKQKDNNIGIFHV
jgi:hypothetical protein